MNVEVKSEDVKDLKDLGGGRGGRGRGSWGARGGQRGGGGRGGGMPMAGGRGGPRGGGPGGMRGGGRGGGGRGGGGRGSPGGGPGGQGLMGSGPGGGGGGGGQGGFRGDRVADKLMQIQGQPTLELPTLDMTEKKFSGRARLYIGNLTPDTTEEQLKELMSQFGEVGEMFFNGEKHFAFLRMARRADAERAKRELDGQARNGRALKVRFAPHQGAVKVCNLGPWVSNELLHRAFSVFGDIERCLVLVDDRGRSRGEGVVEFERKSYAQECVKRCADGCFFLTTSLRPVVVELEENSEDDDGLQDKMLPKRNHDFQMERETGPRFAAPGSFEFEYGQKWKALYEMKRQKTEALEREMKLEEDKLVAQMEYARYEHETERLREQLRRREAGMGQHKSAWEERERQMGEQLRREQERRQEDERRFAERMQQQDQAMRQRRQENSLFMQAQELNSMLDQQEADMEARAGGNGGGGGPVVVDQPFGDGPPGPFGDGMMGGGGPPGGPFGDGGGFGSFEGPPAGGMFMPRGGGGGFRGGRGGRGDFGPGPDMKRRRF